LRPVVVLLAVGHGGAFEGIPRITTTPLAVLGRLGWGYACPANFAITAFSEVSLQKCPPGIYNVSYELARVPGLIQGAEGRLVCSQPATGREKRDAQGTTGAGEGDKSVVEKEASRPGWRSNHRGLDARDCGGVWAQEGTKQAERVFPLDNVYISPCTGEMFRVQGHEVFFREEHVDQNGTLHITYHEVVHGTAVSETGERYVLNGATTIAGQDPSSITTFVSTATFSRLGESGTEDDFVARYISVVKYDANGVPEVISQRWDSQCV